ncbi:MAG TPA: indole-3-glycerol phosphate synthase TrpC [Solirubrobacteraceae bacterium]|nr:indole-3-glycerol phosphate synthase TrpC [Solirubrobacteraceae bacterium]
MSVTVLERILRSTRGEVERRKRERPLVELEAEVARRERELAAAAAAGFQAAAPAGLRQALSVGEGIGVIAEFKRRSPSAGALRESAEPQAIVAAYQRGGARAVSVLTEGPHFGGSLEDLRLARTACGLPLLRKDFTIDSYQLYEARAAGADAVLLIVAALEPAELGALMEGARTLGLDVLVEVHDRQELRVALAAGARLIGINNRDLRDFSVDVERTHELLGDIPAGCTVVSESGIGAPSQLRRLHRAGVAAVLVGETLMRADDPERALRELLAEAGDTAPASAAGVSPQSG